MKFINNTVVCKIKIKGFKQDVVNSVANQIYQIIKLLKFNSSGLIPLPTKTKKFTVLSSPHVNKKSREQFEIRKYTKIITIKVDSVEVESLDLLLNYLEKYIPLNTTLEITKYKHIMLKQD